MTAPVIPNPGTEIVTELFGDELFSFVAGSQQIKDITAANLARFVVSAERIVLTAQLTLNVSVMSGTIAGGSGYTTGTYYGVDVTGGSGTGLTAQVIVGGGAVAVFSPVSGSGDGYKIGDVLSVAAGDIGGTGSGFTFTVTTIGSDTVTATSGSVSNPFATPQAAYSYAQSTYDVGGQLILLQMADGVYPGVYLAEGWTGQGFIQFRGDTSTVRGVVIDGNIDSDAGGFCFLNLDPFLQPVINFGWLTFRNAPDTSTLSFQASIHVRLWDQLNANGAGVLYFWFRGSNSANVRLAGSAVELEDFSDAIDLDYTDSGADSQRAFLDADGEVMAVWSNIKSVTGGAAFSDAFFKLTAGALCQYNKDPDLTYDCSGFRAILNAWTELSTFGSGLSSIPGDGDVQLLGGTWGDSSSNVYGSDTYHQFQGTIFSDLPNPASYPGMVAYVTDSTVGVIGQTVAGSGGIKVLARSDGTNWLVYAGPANSGFSGTIVTAQLTPSTGMQGSMTFVNGILTAQTAAT